MTWNRSSSVGEIVSPIEYSPMPLRSKKTTTQTKASSSKAAAVVLDSKPPVKAVSKTVVPPAVPVAAPETRPWIFTIESPVREKETKKKDKVDEGYRMFLQACFRCKKKFKPHNDVFMYGYLRAFCSHECRDDQLDLDYMGRAYEKPIAKVMSGLKKPITKVTAATKLGSQK
ncbi:uncharacterized protein LOC132311812 [Cornus florida]|uniref:uncharacterized protein LOC132311812 n=1 Tax=Cornus florida TaxID=4283 RepID=UPI002898C17C|nr:uncharacterized protein LOC132311812 [Cornus florida]